MALGGFLRYLERPDVDEVVLQTGKVAAVGTRGTFRPITREPLPTNQVVGLLAGEGLTHYLPNNDGDQRHEVMVGDHELEMLVQRRGSRLTIRFTRFGTRPQTPQIPGDAIPAQSSELTPPPGTVPVPPNPPPQTPRSAPATSTHAVQPSTATPRAAAPAASATPAPALARSPPGPRAPTATSRPGATPPKTVPAAPSELLRRARREGASDVHLAAGRSPMVRRIGRLVPEGAPLAASAVEDLVEPLLSPRDRTQVEEKGYADFACELEGAGRVRVNVCRQRLGLKVCFRLVADAPPTLSSLGLPEELAKVNTYHQGLAVVSGPNGQGKTTTMAALVELLNASKPVHIITVEDPVEVLFPMGKAVISQREVGAHTESFSRALKAALREDPDVIVIGELRDRETVEMALSAAETGHLVIATMSTPSGAKTIDRLIDMFPPDDQQQVRATLAGALKIVVSQRLVPSKDGTRLHAAAELITGNIPLWTLIRDNKLYQLPSLLQRGRRWGMIRVEDSLKVLLDEGLIDEATARRYADDPRFFDAKATSDAPDGAPDAGPGGPQGSIQDRLGNLFGRNKR